MNVNAFEEEVLGMCGNDYEAPHTIASDLARELKRPVTESEVRGAFLSLAEKGLVDAYSVDKSANRLLPISRTEAARDESAWFYWSAEGRKWYEAS
jgi:hypothetical protein